jgi:hypothetical protein
MLAKVTPTKRTNQDDAPMQKGQHPPAEERYRLRVDGQEKRSFRGKEAAITAAQVVKKAFPVVMVTVVDAEVGTSEVISV